MMQHLLNRNQLNAKQGPITILAQSAAQTQSFAAALASILQPKDIIYLQGDLGTGKTFLSQNLIRQLGHQGKVLSPTYSLVQTYDIQLPVTHSQLHSETTTEKYSADEKTTSLSEKKQATQQTPIAQSIQLHHFDLYRLADPLELEYIGLRDYLNDMSICLVEWPSKGVGMLPPATITIRLAYVPENQDSREISVQFAH